VIKIRLSTLSPEWPWIRQTPGSKSIWGNCKFFVDQDVEECDYWVVYEGLMEPASALCPPENTILITGEPPTVKRYDPRFLMQFATVITCHRNIHHPNVIHTQQALPWHVGRRVKNGVNIVFTKDYDELRSISSLTNNKDKLISVISSDKAFTRSHKQRLAFVKRLGEHFGDKIDVFGRGIYAIEDKWDAIARYKYHISLENSSFPDYWTEKLSDAFLGMSYPFYYGCPNLADYFPKEAFTMIEIDDFDSTFTIIEKAIENDYYDKSLELLRIARCLVLDKYNLFAMLAEFCNNQQSYSKPQHIVLKPEHQHDSRTIRIFPWTHSK